MNQFTLKIYKFIIGFPYIEKRQIFALHFKNYFTTDEDKTNQNEEKNPKKISNEYQPVTNSINPCNSKELQQTVNRLANNKKLRRQSNNKQNT
jgi:hypothetical protein